MPVISRVPQDRSAKALAFRPVLGPYSLLDQGPARIPPRVRFRRNRGALQYRYTKREGGFFPKRKVDSYYETLVPLGFR
ncbi:hypothetical protein J2T17_005424 [Paenibacillus mucilaginosus]